MAADLPLQMFSSHKKSHYFQEERRELSQKKELRGGKNMFVNKKGSGVQREMSLKSEKTLMRFQTLKKVF